MLDLVIGILVGALIGAWMAYRYSGKLIADAQNVRARLENEVAKLKTELGR